MNDYELPNIFPSDIFSEVVKVGKGSYATIYVAKHIPTQSNVALKVFDNKKATRAEIDAEINIHKSLSHPFIAKYFGTMDLSESKTALIMEYVEGISLLERVNFRHCLCEADARRIFAQLLSAVKYLHTVAHITHRDLKLENILIDGFGNVRVIDFGFSSSNFPLMKTHLGSFPYCAPELFSAKCYTQSVDIWAMGVLLYAMIEGRMPFATEKNNIPNLIKKIKHDEPFYSDRTSPECVDLMKRIFIKEPSNRISLDEIIDHPWFSFLPSIRTMTDEIDLFFNKENAEKSFESLVLSRKNYPFLLNQVIMKIQHAEGIVSRKSAETVTEKPLKFKKNHSINEIPRFKLFAGNGNEQTKPLKMNVLHQTGLLIRKGNQPKLLSMVPQCQTETNLLS